MRLVFKSAVLAITLTLGACSGMNQGIEEKVLQWRLSQYKGNCPCPYSIAADNSVCGGRSAYSRPGGEDPICYVSEVTVDDIAAYLARN